MCGIYGEVHFDGRVDIDESIQRLHRLRHRGPDGWGVAVGDFRSKSTTVAHNREPEVPAGFIPNLLLGHHRLTIIDLSDSALQPMSTQDEEYHLVFNGEIYNHAEIKKDLLSRGHTFRTDHSDTEVLLLAFAEWGEQCLQRLRGMFAFAIYCRTAKKLFIARDRIGQKPLCFQFTRDRFTFASELWPIAAQPDIDVDIDRGALAQYLLLGYVPHPATILSGIQKLEPGHFAWIDLDARQMSRHKYWDLDLSDLDSRPDRREWEHLVRAELETSVRYRLIADVPLGLFLSGGIDSTLITKLVSEASSTQTRAYHADFRQKNFSEREWSEVAAMHYHIDMRTTMIDLEAARRYEEFIDVLDEPFDGGSSPASYEMFRRASGETKVILTGDGGDELFAGYDRYYQFQQRAALGKTLRKARLSGLLELLGRAFQPVHRHIKRLPSLFTDEHVLDYLALHNDPTAVSLLNEPPGDWRALFGFMGPLLDMQPTSIRALQYLELKTTLPCRMLFKLDRNSMAWSIEGRSPFMDHKLVELAFRIPETHTVDFRGGKRVLKDILRRDLGNRYVYRRKKGFGNPLDYWFTGAAAPQILATVRDPDALLYEYLDFDRVASRITAIKTEYDGSQPRLLWRLVVLARYLERLHSMRKAQASSCSSRYAH